MSAERDQYKSNYAAFTARERELARSRARRDTLDTRAARGAVHDGGKTEGRPAPTADSPAP
jgi:hypothetical protein